MGLDFGYISGQTPIDEEEQLDLLIPGISMRSELDEFEQQNIEEALLWVIGRKLTAEKILSESFIRQLHKRMLGEVWKWAGTYRKSNKNIGVDKWQIPVALKQLCDDALFWHKSGTFEPDEMAIRFKHRLVSIHCFPNGNGRHSRLMADIIADKLYNLRPFTWGRQNLIHLSEVRSEYLKVLRQADAGEFTPLIRFARS